MTETTNRAYADTINTLNRGVVRLSTLKGTDRIKIRFGNRSRWITVRDIPVNVANLSCGHTVRGIALAQSTVVFCETCHDDAFIVEVQ